MRFNSFLRDSLSPGDRRVRPIANNRQPLAPDGGVWRPVIVDQALRARLRAQPGALVRLRRIRPGLQPGRLPVSAGLAQRGEALGIDPRATARWPSWWCSPKPLGCIRPKSNPFATNRQLFIGNS
jgi:hypothetical protein